MKRKIECEDCQHFRPQTSFVDAYKLYYQGAPRVPVMESLKSVQKEEMEILGQEAELLFELFRVEECEWPSKPRVAPYCAAGGRVQVTVVKNRRGDCPDFEEALSRQGRGCHGCAYAVDPETKVGDRDVDLDDHDPKYWPHYMSINKDRADADAMAQALEIEQSFYADGKLPFVYFLPTCAVQITKFQRHVVPFSNLRMDCDFYRGVLPVSKTLMKLTGKRAGRARQPKLTTMTTRLVRAIADTHPKRPTEFLSEACQIEGAQRWAAECVVVRWLQETTTVDPYAMTAATSLGVEVADQPFLLPVIAGCDALEWGALAAMSRSAEIPAAVAFVQQFSEWFTSTFDPTDRIRGVEAGLELVAHGGFAVRTVESVEGFLRQLLTLGDAGIDALHGDFTGYIEGVLASVLVTTADLHAMKASIQPTGIDAMLQHLGMTRDHIDLTPRERVGFAQQQATILQDAMERILRGDLSTELSDLWRSISEGDQKRLVDVITAQRDQAKAAFNIATLVKWLPPLTFGEGLADVVSIFESWGQIDNRAKEVVGLIYAAELRPRHVVLEMLLCRGLSPVSPCALTILNRKPTPQRVPETLREALTEPAGLHVEALHAERFKQSSDARGYLCRIRRISFPVMDEGGS